MSGWATIDTAPRDRVILGWDGAARFLCVWVEDGTDSGWYVANSDAVEDLADDGEGRNRPCDPVYWCELEEPPFGFI